MMLAQLSFIAVFLWIWGQTGSLFIASVGMFEIIASLPLAFFAYRVVFGFSYFAFLNSMCVYIILAVGADDIFVFMDAWKQSAFAGEHGE
jgi:hypothetical protein